VKPNPKSDNEDEEDDYPLVVSKIEANDKERVFIEKTEGTNEIFFK